METINSLNIVARRWFQKTYGNTYHSVKVYVNDEILTVPFAYGYDNHFFQTAQDLLDKAGYDTKLSENGSLGTLHLREVLGGTYSVTDVSRKKDL